jgi:hypothetical protein
MATTCPLPDANKVRSMLGLLFDGLEVKPGRRADLSPASGSWVALYVGDDGRPLALCAADALFAANAGAALSLLPPATAKDAAKTRDLTDVMRGNLAEVMNICSRLLMTDSSPHLRLDGVQPAKSLSPAVTGVMSGATGRADFELTVPRYGPGTLSVLSV